MATITPANLSYKDKDGDLGEVKSLTDTDVTLLNNALQDIEDLKLAYMPGYVKRDFSNVTQAGKDASVSWGMPDYSAGVSLAQQSTSEQTFTMTENGYLAYIFYSSSGNGYIKINDILILTGAPYSRIGNIGQSFTGLISVNKNDIVKFKTYASGYDNYCRLVFYPCKGAN